MTHIQNTAPGPPCLNGCRHAHDVAGADGRRQRRAKALKLADGFIVRVGGHIPVQEDGPDGVPHPVPEIPQLEKSGAHREQQPVPNSSASPTGPHTTPPTTAFTRAKLSHIHKRPLCSTVWHRGRFHARAAVSV